MFDDTEDARQFSYWPSVSDLFMTCFILSLVVLAAFWYIIQPTSSVDYKGVVEVMGGVDLPKIMDPTNKMRVALKTAPLLQRGEPAEKIVTGLSRTADDVVSDISKWEAEVARLEKRVNELSIQNSEIAGLRKKIEELTAQNLEIPTLKKKIEELILQLAVQNANIAALNKKIAELNGNIAQLDRDKKGLEDALNDKPPIIKIAEDGKDGKEVYRFESGKAKVKDDFQKALRSGGFTVLAREIIKRNKARPASVDTLEIIGHTDGVGFSRHGNLDALLPVFLTGGTRDDLATLTPGSNNDLGLLRALAIKKEWLEFVQIVDMAGKEELRKIEIRCYSAGQTIPEGLAPDDPNLRDASIFKKDNPRSRRIEIRLTKLR